MKGFSTMSLKWVNPRAGVLALTTSLVSGCTTVHNIEGQGSTPVPVETALRQLETDLSRVPALVPSNLLLPLDDKTNKWQTTPESNEIRRHRHPTDSTPTSIVKAKVVRRAVSFSRLPNLCPYLPSKGAAPGCRRSTPAGPCDRHKWLFLIVVL